MAKEYTEEELNALTPGERAALEEEDGNETDADAEDIADNDDGGDNDAAGSDDGNADEDGEEGKAEDDDPASDGESQEADNKSEEDGQEESDQAREEVQRENVSPLLNADLPQDIEEQFNNIQTSKDDLVTKFDDGDLTAREYQSELEKLNRNERQLEQKVFKSQIAKEMKQNAKVASWREEVESFLQSNPQYAPGTVRYNALDTEVRRIGSDPANENMKDAEILKMAHERIESELGSPSKRDENEGDNKSRQQRDKPDIPPSLGNLPASEQTETSNSKFKALDKLFEIDPIRHEHEMSKLSEEEQDRYLQAR